MKVLNARFELDQLLGSATRARRRVLFLDFDGTLAPFTSRRDHAKPYAGVAAALRDLSRLPRHRLIFVSGRPARELRGLLDLHPAPLVWGSHGMEQIDPEGHLRAAPLSHDARRLLDHEAKVALSSLSAERVEQKPFGIAVHARDPDASAAAALRALESRWRTLAGRYRLRVRRFDGGLELCAANRTKADAVSATLHGLEAPFAAAYLGDDLTDEDGFRAIRLRGASVLVRNELRPTAADLWLRPPDELLAFLTGWRDAVLRDAR